MAALTAWPGTGLKLSRKSYPMLELENRSEPYGGLLSNKRKILPLPQSPSCLTAAPSTPSPPHLRAFVFHSLPPLPGTLLHRLTLLKSHFMAATQEAMSQY